MTKKRLAEPPAKPTSPAAVGNSLRQMEVDEFVRRLKQDGSSSEKKFAFFLGAGCSVSSGIPAAAVLVTDHWLPRLRMIRAPEEPDLTEWAKRTIPDYDSDNPGASYGRLIDELFVTADDRQREIESLCDGRSPAFGYAVLAQLVAGSGSRFNVVLTTNFDDLMADALYLFTDSRPLVIQHESLAAFIRPTRTRPLVVKLHGDSRLAPRNTALETSALEAEIARHTAMVLNDRGLIFMGYGGNDQGILKLLGDLPKDALPSGAYWVHPEEPQGEVRLWLLARGGVWVRSGWFDEVMLLARNAFDLPHPQPDRLTNVFTNYQNKFKELSANISARAEKDPKATLLKRAVTETEKSFPDFWAALSEADRTAESDPVAAGETYRVAVEKFPDAAPLLSSYAVFLERKMGQRAEAEALHKRAVAADRKNAFHLSRYGAFLASIPERRNEAEALHQRALELAPKDGWTITTYAIFLEEDPKRRPEAESVYRRLLDEEIRYGFGLTRFGMYLAETATRRAEAEEIYRRAMETDPTNAYPVSNLAFLLESTPNRHVEAEALFRRAIELDPKPSYVLVRYGQFLRQQGRFPEAESVLHRAVEVNPADQYARAELNRLIGEDSEQGPSGKATKKA